MKYSIILILAVIVTMSSCRDKSQEEQDLLEAYLIEHNITVEPTQSGLYYIEIEEGPSEQPINGSSVTVEYEGRLIDGEVFDSSEDNTKPFIFQLGAGQVIRGWEEGVSYMREGGKAQLIIPSYLGYGSREMGSIPEYSTLIFDVELIEVGNN
ncbi:MAG: FKBP-type peptidyl-prolyl cis-trans isomerase [Bacteroidota bacterium]|nr:FKBP-type peptidyl-prolyl cis-trans isomerase [Bacteroidota bacterium]